MSKNKTPEYVTLPDLQKVDVSTHSPALTAARIAWERSHLWAVHTADEFQRGEESLSGVTKTRAKADEAATTFWKLFNESQSEVDEQREPLANLTAG